MTQHGITSTGALKASSGQTLLYDNTATGTIASWDVTGIPANASHLRIYATAQSNNAAIQRLYMRFNNDSGGNYSWNYIQGVGATMPGVESINDTRAGIGILTGSSSVAEDFGECVVDILNYANPTYKKPYVAHTSCRYTATPGNMLSEMSSGIWHATSAAINRITVFSGTGSLVAGSRLTIYGLL